MPSYKTIKIISSPWEKPSFTGVVESSGNKESTEYGWGSFGTIVLPPQLYKLLSFK